MITLKTELCIYKETAHQDDNVNNYSSFHGASKRDFILEKSDPPVSVVSAAGT